MTEREQLIEAIIQAPADEFLRLVLADHLEEHGEWEAAERVRETVRIRPFDDRANNSERDRWAAWLVWSPSDVSDLSDCPKWLYSTLVGRSYPNTGWSKRWPTEQEGMRAIIEAVLKGGPGWQPSSCGTASSGSSGAAASGAASAS